MSKPGPWRRRNTPALTNPLAEVYLSGDSLHTAAAFTRGLPMSRPALAALVLVCGVRTASPQVQAVGDISFAVPAGWQYDPPRSGDGPATMDLGSGDSTSVIAVFTP